MTQQNLSAMIEEMEGVSGRAIAKFGEYSHALFRPVEILRLCAALKKYREALDETAKLLTWQCEGPYGSSPMTDKEVLELVRKALREPEQ